MANIIVTLPGRGQITFEEGTPDSVINETIAREFPKDGSDVARIIAEDPTQAKSLSNEDFGLYEEFLDKKKTDFGRTAANAAGYLASTVGAGIKGLFEARNLNPEVAAATAIESGAQGTRDLYGMVAQSEDPSSMFFKFKDWINGTGAIEDRKKQWLEARDFSENTRKMEAGQQTVSGIDPSLINNDVKNALKLIADPTLFIPGVGELLGAGKLGARVTGAAMEAAGRTAQAVTRPLVNIVDASTRMAGEAFGANANAVKGLAAGSGVTGVVMGVPGVREAAIAYGTVEGVNKAGQVLETAGQALGRTPTRIGALESLALNPNASAVDRALAKVGRYGGDDLIDIGARSAAGAVEGAAIGTTLGYLSAGEEGAASGLGAGTLLGGAGAGAARLYGKASGAAAIENRHGDFKRFYETLDPATQAKFDTIVQRSGLDGASQVMDVSGIIRGKFNDVDINYLEPKEFIEKHGSNARGAEKVDGERPVIDINIGSFDTQRTVGHELFHAFKAIDQLRPLAERVESMIVGNYIIDGNGQSVKTSSGILSETDTIKKFDEYLSKFKGADGNVNLPPDSPWVKANTVFEKTKLVGEELGAEYMSRMITGSNTDAMFRGFDGITRTILDNALLDNTEGFMRRTAQSIGLGSKPIESLVFANMEKASPALNAALRDMVRARRNMTKKIELAEGTGYVLTRLDIANAAAFEQMKKLGIAETDKNGSPVMRSDDVITQEDRGSLAEIKKIIMSAPVSDANEPRLRDLDGKIVGDGISAAQIDAIMASPLVIDKVKESFTHIKNAMDNGNVIRTKYGKALKKVKNWISGKNVNRYNDGVRMTGSRDILPYEIKENKAGELYFNGFDLTKARNAAMDLASKGGLGPWGQDFQLFYGDLVRYANNLSDQVHQVPTKELFGDANAAAFMTDFFGGKDGTDSKFIRSFTLDRLVEILPTDEKVAMTLRAYTLNKARYMPAETIGDGKVFNSPDSGFKIISKDAGKHSLYAPTGERVGIYDTQAKAEAISNKLINQSTRISVSDPKIVDGIVTAPESGAFKFTKDIAANFMPADSKVRLDDYADRTIIALAADRMGVGQAEVGPFSNRRVLSVPTQGGRGYMKIFNGGGWAFSDTATANRFLSRLTQVADKKGNALVGITVLNPINHLNNQTGQLAYIEAMRAAVDGGVVTKSQADAHIKAISDRILLSKAKSLKQTTRDVFSNTTDLKSLENAIKDKALNFNSAAWLVKKAQGKTLPISYKEQVAHGISVQQIARGLADKELLDIPDYSVVALMEVNVNQKPDANNFHYAYPISVHGKTVGFLDKFYNLADLSTNQKIRTKKGRVTAQPVQTVMPILDNIKKTLETQQGIPSDPAQRGEVNFMPGTDSSPAVKVLDELKRSNFVNDKIAKAALGSFPSYLKPVADFIAEQRQKLVGGTLTPRDVAKAYMVTAASQGAGAIFVKTIADKVATLNIDFNPPALFRTEDGKKIRPEEAAAWWLGTENGQRALDNIEKGVAEPADWAELGEVRRAYGDDRFKTQNALNPKNLANIATVTRELNASKGNSSRVLKAVQVLNGVKTGKKGFISHLLGLGDTPTIDAVEINFWLTGQGDIKALNTKKAELARKIKDAQSDRRVSGELFRRIDERISALRGEVPGSEQIDPQVWAHIMHHWLWDKAKGIQTSHAGMYEAQRNFMPSTSAGEQSISSAKTSIKQVPAVFKSPLFKANGTNIDIGAGRFDLGKNHLERERGVTESVPFDPFNRDEATNSEAVRRLQSGERFGTSTIPNVLNVIKEKSIRDNVVRQAARSLQDGGAAYFQIYEGNRTGGGRVTGAGWQNNKKTSLYIGEINAHFDNVKQHGNIVVAKSPRDNVSPANWLLSDKGPMVSFQPAMQFSAPENLPNGKVWRGENGYAIIQKEGGKFRVHSPIGLIGIAASYEAAEKMANKRNTK